VRAATHRRTAAVLLRAATLRRTAAAPCANGSPRSQRAPDAPLPELAPPPFAH
jgi:hypothetical protein